MGATLALYLDFLNLFILPQPCTKIMPRVSQVIPNVSPWRQRH
jgi:hypothetical protein